MTMRQNIALVPDAKSYSCEEQGCNKSFQRSDHLARHRQNHTRSSLYACNWPGCNKQFVRKDVRKKHFERHQAREHSKSLKKSRPIRFLSSELTFLSESHSHNDGVFPKVKGVNYEKGSSAELNNNMKGKLDRMKLLFNGENTANTNELLPRDQSVAEGIPDISSLILLDLNESDRANHLLPDLMSWLFDDTSYSMENRYSSFNVMDYSPNSAFNEMLNASPYYATSDQTGVDRGSIDKMLKYIPSLESNPDFRVEHIELCLENYWLVFHVQYPILHRSSFSAKEAHPLLLLSMIAIGASFVSHVQNDFSLFQNAHHLADNIAVPLRWKIFSAVDSTPPATPWLIQSLIILECYEMTSSTRILHQRAYLHRGLTFQLLRRSPFLGCDRSTSSKHEEKLDEEGDAWKRWIESESLKRCALMACLIDATHAIIFGHETVVSIQQVKLSLPCDDTIWEMSRIDKYNLPPQTETIKFLAAISKLLHNEKFEVGPFSRKVVFAGLLMVVFLIEKENFHIKMLENERTRESWKDTIFNAMNFWLDSICHGSCCDGRITFYTPFGDRPKLASFEDSACKLPLYHVSQVFLRLSQYDCIIYAGAPSRMNVKTDVADYEAVSRRIHEWAVSPSGKISVIHAYKFISEILLVGPKDMSRVYEPRTDCLLYRPNIVASLVFVIWAYNYCLEGPEGFLLENISFKSIEELAESSKINGFDYLRKIKGIFSNFFTTNDFRKMEAADTCASILNSISGKNHTVGLLNLFYTEYEKCESHICQEYAKLMGHCIKRSLGYKNIVCEDMYEYSTSSC
ncbi:uncharacterized protein PRCAT00005823001 [Priceomyces carsonii]|uniref:uncharacterized protein n=1 Tax=Priceomyces carsonii TaxID=28549 RepID=UPI002EDB1758|nr:unnamed protein product [Priceomyces carsonii]